MPDTSSPLTDALRASAPEPWNLRRELKNLSDALNGLVHSELEEAREHVAEGNSHKAAPLYERAEAYRDAVDLVESVIRNVPANLLTMQFKPDSLKVTPLKAGTLKVNFAKSSYTAESKRLVHQADPTSPPERGNLVTGRSWATGVAACGLLTDESDTKKHDGRTVDVVLIKRLVSFSGDVWEWRGMWVLNDDTLKHASDYALNLFNADLMHAAFRSLDELGAS